MDNLKEDATEKVTETVHFKEDPKEKVSHFELEMKKKILDEIVQQFAHDYFKENPEKEWFHFEAEIMEKIGKGIIENYCSNFTQNVKKFLSIVEEIKCNDIIKKVKIGLAIGGGVLAVAGVVAASVAFPLAPVAAGAVVTVASVDAAAAPFIAGLTVGAGGALTSAGAGLSALLSKRKKKDSSSEELSFCLIPPEEFVEGNIKFELCIGQVIYPLNIPDN